MRLALLVHGPFVGTATLQAWCPALSRRVITAWRQRDRRRQRQRLAVLRWTRPGRVWAMDFSTPPQPIDGTYAAILHVRDLASQHPLAALPVVRATATAACDLLRTLCASYDAPLVLKIDNGSAFVSRELQAWAAQLGILMLYSPAACPRYNGSIEASIGALTTRAHHAAAAAGHPESWTCADVEAARIEANAQAAARATRITAAERRRFQAQYTRTSGGSTAITRAQQRTAIAHTLQVLGYVSITRRADLVH